MGDTAEVSLTKDIWTDLSGINKKGLLTNRSQNKLIVAESISSPVAGSSLGHVLNPNDDINLNLSGTRKLWGLSKNFSGLISVTPLAGFSKDNFFTEDFLCEVNKGNIPGHSLVHKFARNPDAGTSAEEVWYNGGVLTPLTVAATMEAISANANDTVAGSRARTIRLFGLDADFNEIEETINMNGTTVTSATTQSFLRINKARVLTTGTYNVKNQGDIIIRVSGGGVIQANIEAETSVTQKSQYTVPADKTGYVLRISLDVDSAKTARFILHERGNTNLTSAPFDPVKHVHTWDGISGHVDEDFKANHLLSEKTDVWMESVAGSINTALECDYDILLVDNNA